MAIVQNSAIRSTISVTDQSRNGNELADAEDFTTITKRINGGLTGLAERQRYYEVAKKALGLAP
jgi:predicted chitinase